MFKRSIFFAFVSFYSLNANAEENRWVACAKDNIPEALVSGGLYAAVLNPASLVVGLVYYGNSLYRCNKKMEESSVLSKSLEKKETEINSRLDAFNKSMTDFDNSFKSSNERISRTEEELKKSVQDSLSKVKEDYLNLNKSLVEYTDKIKEKQVEFTNAVDGKIEEMKSSKNEYLKEIEEKSNSEKENIMIVGDEAIKNIYKELKKIEETEVKIERKIEDNGVTKESVETLKPLDKIDEKVQESTKQETEVKK